MGAVRPFGCINPRLIGGIPDAAGRTVAASGGPSSAHRPEEMTRSRTALDTQIASETGAGCVVANCGSRLWWWTGRGPWRPCRWAPPRPPRAPSEPCRPVGRGRARGSEQFEHLRRSSRLPLWSRSRYLLADLASPIVMAMYGPGPRHITRLWFQSTRLPAPIREGRPRGLAPSSERNSARRMQHRLRGPGS